MSFNKTIIIIITIITLVSAKIRGSNNPNKNDSPNYTVNSKIRIKILDDYHYVNVNNTIAKLIIDVGDFIFTAKINTIIDNNDYEIIGYGFNGDNTSPYSLYYCIGYNNATNEPANNSYSNITNTMHINNNGTLNFISYENIYPNSYCEYIVYINSSDKTTGIITYIFIAAVFLWIGFAGVSSKNRSDFWKTLVCINSYYLLKEKISRKKITPVDRINVII
jgi:hypothetical protein